MEVLEYLDRGPELPEALESEEVQAADDFCRGFLQDFEGDEVVVFVIFNVSLEVVPCETRAFMDVAAFFFAAIFSIEKVTTEPGLPRFTCSW